ncbi:type II secretion system protein J [Paraburkholderia fungorum]|uniref:Type II secretory pathway protein n=1 Tax=Paraburkholderia fungorum TaxID=134537 RepID=A0A3R7EW16_9BURK|nr:prepilin-type N-terminal cleavage/methylation domain-containing protein [Paraburkholderia fungorum]RKF50615.1 type II secretory pathway protein [Paraburkholderia fungorum]
MKHARRTGRIGNPGSRAGQSAFTLIEMLVAIALLALVAVLCWRGLDATIRTREDVVSHLTRTRNLARYFSQLQFDTLNMAAPQEIGGAPLRILPNELVIVRHLGIGNGPTRLQIVRYQLKNRQLLRSASTPLTTLTEVKDAALHMDGFAGVVALDDVRSMNVFVWMAPAWTDQQQIITDAYARFLRQYAVGTISTIGMPLPRGIRFSISTGSPAVGFVRTMPLAQ